MKIQHKTLVMLFISIFIGTHENYGQEVRSLSLAQMVDEALENNLYIKSTSLQAAADHSLIGTALDLPKTNLSLTYGQANSMYKDNNFVINQSLTGLATYGYQKKYLTQKADLTLQQVEITKNELRYQVKQLYYQLQFHLNKSNLLQQQDSIYYNFARAAGLRYKTGESNLLEKSTSEMLMHENQNLMQQNEADIQILSSKLQLLLNSTTLITTTPLLFEKRTMLAIADTSLELQNPTMEYLKKSILVNSAFTKTEKNRRMPDLSIGYFNQSLRGIQNINGTERYFGLTDRFQGVTLGLAVPMWMSAYNAKIASAQIHEKIADQNLKNYNAQLNNDYFSALQELKKCNTALLYYEQQALTQADNILKSAQKSYKSGDINYMEYSNALNKVLSIKNNHLDQLLKHNLAVIKIEFITGK